MSSQVVVMNRNGLAMCTDSAVTVPGLQGQSSVYNEGRKLFPVCRDIGLMTYNLMNHCSVALEDIIQGFKEETGGDRKATLSDCSGDFLKHVSGLDIPSNFASERNVKWLVHDLERGIRAASGNLEARISALLGTVRQAEPLFKVEKEAFHKENGDFLTDTLEKHPDVYGKPPSANVIRGFSGLCCEAVSRSFSSNVFSGLVFAGYGKSEFFPCVEHWTIDGVYKGKLRYWKDKKSSHDMNQERNALAHIIPFAQRDVTDLVLAGFDKGITNDLRRLINDLVRKFLNNSLNNGEAGMKVDKENIFVGEAVISAINHMMIQNSETFLKRVSQLPKNELAEMARTLVKVTSVRRMIDRDLRTVGGPVNVGVISKSDGFVWLPEREQIKPEQRFRTSSE